MKMKNLVPIVATLSSVGFFQNRINGFSKNPIVELSVTISRYILALLYFLFAVGFCACLVSSVLYKKISWERLLAISLDSAQLIHLIICLVLFVVSIATVVTRAFKRGTLGSFTNKKWLMGMEKYLLMFLSHHVIESIIDKQDQSSILFSSFAYGILVCDSALSVIPIDWHCRVCSLWFRKDDHIFFFKKDVKVCRHYISHLCYQWKNRLSRTHNKDCERKLLELGISGSSDDVWSKPGLKLVTCCAMTVGASLIALLFKPGGFPPKQATGDVENQSGMGNDGQLLKTALQIASTSSSKSESTSSSNESVIPHQ